MPKPLTFLLGDEEISLTLNKLDRSRLYGSKELEVVDENGEACELATLADDGRTLIGRGGTGLGWLDAEGSWAPKSTLKPVNVDGDEIKPVESSFSGSIKLFDTVSAEQYLEHNIRLVYALESSDTGDEQAATVDSLRQELARGTIFSFPYSYRGGLEADAAFLLMNEEAEIILAVGTQTEVNFVGIQSQLAFSEEPSSEFEDVDAMDFDMI